jgi:hypothetical protein
MKNSTGVLLSVVVALLISLGVGYVVIRGVQSNLAQLGGGLSDRDINAVSLKVGQNGSKFGTLKATTCNLAITAGRLPLATSSQPFQCAITGVKSGDFVSVWLASDGGSLSGTGGIQTSYAKASTTAGYIEVGLYSRPTSIGTTVATSSFSLATTSVQVLFAQKVN